MRLPARASRCILRAALLSAAASASVLGAEPATPSGCTLKPGPERTVTAVVDAETLALDDGSELKLAGMLGPRALDVAADVAEWPPEAAAKAALADLVVGRNITAHPVTARSDRYGRLIAHVFVERDGVRQWVQGRMLRDGHARAHDLAGNFVCAEELIAHERQGRELRAGLWSNAAYRERSAFRTRELLRLRSTFQLVTGRVHKVAETKSAIYLNFGADWRADFTAGFKTGRNALATPERTELVRQLEGRMVRVRGWIERRNGPYIEIEHASDIETIDDAAAPAVAARSGDAARGQPLGIPRNAERPGR